MGITLVMLSLKLQKPFTLKDPDANIVYGANDDKNLVVNGPAILVIANGWHKLTADANDLTYVLKVFNVGLIGSATPNGWNSPDTKMEYNAQGDYWHITVPLVVGDMQVQDQ